MSSVSDIMKGTRFPQEHEGLGKDRLGRRREAIWRKES